MGARTEGGTEGKEEETEDLGSNSTNDSSMAWRGVVAPNSSDNRGGASLATVAVVEEVLGGRAEGVVVDLPGGGAVVQSLSTPPRPVATYSHHRTRHTFHGPKAVRQQFTPMILARDAPAVIKLVIVIRNVRMACFKPYRLFFIRTTLPEKIPQPCGIRMKTSSFKGSERTPAVHQNDTNQNP